MLISSEDCSVVDPYTFWQALFEVIFGGDVPEVLLVAIANGNEVSLDEFVFQIHEEDSEPMFFFDGLLNFLMTVGALNKKVGGFLVGAITIETLHPHTFEVFQQQQADKRGNERNDEEHGLEQIKLQWPE